MFLSIIVPVYNREKYISECLDSLLCQDISISDYEIICVNDGSTDNSLQILKEYTDANDNIIVINQENGGVSVARNTAMDIAKGDYIWFVDPDDFIAPNVLQGLKTASKSEFDYISFGMYKFDVELSDVEKEELKNATLKANTDFIGQANSILKRSSVGELRWRKGILHGQDSVFLREYFLEERTSSKIDVLVYFYRQHAQSTIHGGVFNQTQKMFSDANAAIIMKSIYEQKKCRPNAEILGIFLTRALYYAASINNEDSKKVLELLKNNDLFPMKKLPEAVNQKSYIVSGDNLKSKLINKMIVNSKSKLGFFVLKNALKLRNINK